MAVCVIVAICFGLQRAAATPSSVTSLLRYCASTTCCLRRQISFGDYDAFYNSKALWHTELDEIATSTQHKLRQNLFRMLRDADLISDQQHIQAAMLSPRLAQLLARRG
jgi:hypothetical protein